MIRLCNSWFTWSTCAGLYILSTFCADALRADSKGREVLPFPALEVSTMPVITEAIGTHERSFIITQVAERGKWEGERNGAHISIARLNPLVFSFGVSIRAAALTGSRITAEAAIDAANDAVERLKSKPKPMFGREPDPNRTGMRKLAHTAASDDKGAQQDLLEA